MGKRSRPRRSATQWDSTISERQRRQRVDAQRNLGSLLEAATTAFATSGVDAPAKEIAALAGVGVSTLYRLFPRRSDLVVAVLEREIDVCAEAGSALSAIHEPATALTQWLDRYTAFVASNEGWRRRCTCQGPPDGGGAPQSPGTGHRA